MASILVYIENDGECPSPASLQVLGEGRRIATTLGAVLYAFAPIPEDARDSENARDARDSESAEVPSPNSELANALGRAGADKVVITPIRDSRGPAIWLHHGIALHSICELLSPRVILLPATPTGRDIAPRLATRLSAALWAEPAIQHAPEGEVFLSHVSHRRSQDKSQNAITERSGASASRSGAFRRGSEAERSEPDATDNSGAIRTLLTTIERRISLEDIPQCTVLTLNPDACEQARGMVEVRAQVLEPPVSPTGGLEYLDSSPDPGAALESARIVVVAGGGVTSAEGYELVGKLAGALGGELGATRTLVESGIAPAERMVGVGSRHVAPAMYVACACSGSREHLGAISRTSRIVAINSDPEAPIFGLATYGVMGDLETVIPALIAALPGTIAKKAVP